MWLVLIGLPKIRGVLPVCSWIAEMPLSDSQVCALKAGECRQNKFVGDSRRLVVKSVAKGGVQIFGGAETLAASTAGPAGSCADGLFKQTREAWDRLRGVVQADGNCSLPARIPLEHISWDQKDPACGP